jgi:hypothetical protein
MDAAGSGSMETQMLRLHQTATIYIGGMCGVCSRLPAASGGLVHQTSV